MLILMLLFGAMVHITTEWKQQQTLCLKTIGLTFGSVWFPFCFPCSCLFTWVASVVWLSLQHYIGQIVSRAACDCPVLSRYHLGACLFCFLAPTGMRMNKTKKVSLATAGGSSLPWSCPWEGALALGVSSQHLDANCFILDVVPLAPHTLSVHACHAHLEKRILFYGVFCVCKYEMAND